MDPLPSPAARVAAARWRDRRRRADGPPPSWRAPGGEHRDRGDRTGRPAPGDPGPRRARSHAGPASRRADRATGADAVCPRTPTPPALDRTWLELVAAVRPRLAALEARQFDPCARAVAGGALDRRRVARSVAPGRPGARRLRSRACATGGPGGDRGARRVDRLGAQPPTRHRGRFRLQRAQVACAAGGAARRPARSGRSARPTPGCSTWCCETRELAHARADPADDRRAALRHPAPLVHATGRLELPRRMAGMSRPAVYFWLEPGRSPTATKGCAPASPTRSGSSPGSGSSASCRARTRPARSGRQRRAAHVPITYDPGPARIWIRPWSRPRRCWRPSPATGGRSAGGCVWAGPPPAARCADAPIGPYSLRRAARAVRAAGGRGRRPRRVSLARARRSRRSGREVPSTDCPTAGRRAELRLQRDVRSRRHDARSARITTAATSTGSPSTAIRAVTPCPTADPPPTRQVIPGRLDYPGAPNPRWWQIEDRAVDIGGFAPDRSHLATMLLLDVALAHADDWFSFPVPPPRRPRRRPRRRRAACW